MKYLVLLAGVMAASISSSMAAPTTVDPESSTLSSNGTTTNETSTEETIRIPFLVVVEQDKKLNFENDINADNVVQDLKWMVIKKTTNISRVEEVFADDANDKTRRVIVEDRAEEFKVFQDNSHHQALNEKFIKKLPLNFLD